MNRTILIYLGITFTVIASSIGLVFAPDFQLAMLQPYEDEAGNMWPVEPYGDAVKGREVYQDLGCIYCHSQQVRDEDFGADIDRGWGLRRSVARDYIYDSPHLMGTMRTGPDLHNIAMRQPDDNWHYQHLYRPTLTSPGSNMAPYRFLFQRVRVEPGADPPRDHVRMPEDELPADVYLVPTDRARHLIAYLKSLEHSYDLPEAHQ